jgi:hypothetical protein
MSNPDGSQDVNTVSLYGADSNTVKDYTIIDGRSGTAALKITSKAFNIRVTADNLIGGTENCLDLNNECNAITVEAKVYGCEGKYAISAKTCDNITLRGHISGTPKEWHVNLGSWSDQSNHPQTNTHLALTADNYPIMVWLGNADEPIFDDKTKYKIIGFGSYGKLVRGVVMFLWGAAKKIGIPI